MKNAITKDNWALVTKNGDPVLAHTVHTDFRGDTAIITGGTPPHKPSASGYVHTAAGESCYVGVYDMQWVKDEPVPPPGYTADELERDNPYNQWMYAE